MGWYIRGMVAFDGFCSLASRNVPQNLVFHTGSRIFQSGYSNSGSKGTCFYGFSSFCSVSQKVGTQDPKNIIIKWYCETFQDPDNILKWYNESLQTVPFTKRTRHVYLPIPLERSLMEGGYQKIKATFEGKILPPTHSDSVRVRIIAKNIIDALQKEVKKMGYASEHTKLQATTSHLDGLNWEVFVVNDPATNAFSTAGGKIIVNTGWLERFRSDAEIATIIGHEVGHIVARHHAENFGRMPWRFVLLQLVKKKFTPGFVSRVSFIIQSHPLLRQMETEADYIGLLLIASAGYDPRVAPKVYEKLVRKTNCFSFMFKGSHPCGRERAELLAHPKIMEEALIKYKESMVERLVLYSFSSLWF